MCFFDQHRFQCDDWKWGHFRQHCNREWRVGETCGLKLVMQTISVDGKCKLCEKIDAKFRRRNLECERIKKWQREGIKFKPSIEKALETIAGLDADIRELYLEKTRRVSQIPNAKNTPKKVTPTLTRRALPFTFLRTEGAVSALACPDSGSDINIISLELTSVLGLTEMIQPFPEELPICMADGKFTSSLGVINLLYTFPAEYMPETSYEFCHFHVLETFPSHLLVGHAFLEYENILTVCQYRLIELPVVIDRAPRVQLVDCPRRELICAVDGKATLAVADTRSEVDLMSPSFASRWKLSIEPWQEELLLADGTIALTEGVVKTSLAVGDLKRLSGLPPAEFLESEDTEGKPDIKDAEGQASPFIDISRLFSSEIYYSDVTFYILPGLTCEVLIGESTLCGLRVFSDPKTTMVTREEADQFANIQRITLKRSMACRIRKFLGLSDQAVDVESAGAPSEPLPSNLQDIIERDQRENARREREIARILQLPAADRQAALDAENRTVEAYDAGRNQIMEGLRRHGQV